MGGPCELRAYPSSKIDTQAAFAVAELEIKRLELAYSRYLPHSITSHINAVAGSGKATRVDSETARLLDYANTLWRESDGLFDITSGSLREIWNFREPEIPAPAALAAQLQLVGWEKVSWDGESIELPVAGMAIDFGGIVKEYACDSAAKLLQREGLNHALVDLAGDIAVSGPQFDQRPWSIGISDPARPTEALASIGLAAGGLASSGDYQRGFTLAGRRYGHLLNPKTGWPTQGLSAVSVRADQCLVAGSTATIAILKGKRDGIQWLQDLGLPWLAVDDSGSVHGSLDDSAKLGT
jgi:thiamine biosynthesis lipoprotein